MSFILITNSLSCCWKSVALVLKVVNLAATLATTSVSHLPEMKRNEIRKQQDSRVSQSIRTDLWILKSRYWWDELGLLNVCVPQICRRKQLMMTEFVLLSQLLAPPARRTQIDNCELSATAGSDGLLHLHSAAFKGSSYSFSLPFRYRSYSYSGTRALQIYFVTNRRQVQIICIAHPLVKR